MTEQVAALFLIWVFCIVGAAVLSDRQLKFVLLCSAVVSFLAMVGKLLMGG